MTAVATCLIWRVSVCLPHKSRAAYPVRAARVASVGACGCASWPALSRCRISPIMLSRWKYPQSARIVAVGMSAAVARLDWNRTGDLASGLWPPGDRFSRGRRLNEETRYRVGPLDDRDEPALRHKLSGGFRQRSRHGLFDYACHGYRAAARRSKRWIASGAAQPPFRNGASAPLRVTAGSAAALAASSSTSGVKAL